MAKKIKQYRYYGRNSSNANFPLDLTREGLISGFAFTESIPITQLGIQTLPGTVFYVNNSPEPVVVGSTGIYELDLSSGTFITNLRFDIESIRTIENISTAYLIVDVVYEVEEE